MKKENEKRMYVLVAYNLSDIQKGIQAAHAIAEYSNMKDMTYGFEEVIKRKFKYHDWVVNWKTIIMLDGGTTGKNGTLQDYLKDLNSLNVSCSVFYEPDLNNAMTAVAFLLDVEEDSHVIGYLKQMRLA